MSACYSPGNGRKRPVGCPIVQIPYLRHIDSMGLAIPVPQEASTGRQGLTRLLWPVHLRHRLAERDSTAVSIFLFAPALLNGFGLQLPDGFFEPFLRLQREAETHEAFWQASVLVTKVVDARFVLWRCPADRSTLFGRCWSSVKRETESRVDKWHNKRKDKLFGDSRPEPIFLGVDT